MKKSHLVGLVGAIVVIGALAWLWHAAVQRKQDTRQEQAQGGQAAPSKMASMTRAHHEPAEVTRFAVTFRPTPSSDKTGSATYAGQSIRRTERPGDKLLIQMEGMGFLFVGTGSMFGGHYFHVGDGSEIRFVDTYRTESAAFKGEADGRLVFRKSEGDWAYVCGLGQYEEEGTVTKLGHNRTVASCLELLKSDDAILREGGARDLGRLSTPEDAAKVVPRLIETLRDSSAFVRRGAIEGLGLIGTTEACAALQVELANERDETTKEYIEEALGFCAAYAVLRDPGAAAEPPEAGLDRLVGKPDAEDKGKEQELNDWVAVNLNRRIALRSQEAAHALEEASASTNPKIARLAPLLKPLTQTVPEKGQ